MSDLAGRVEIAEESDLYGDDLDSLTSALSSFGLEATIRPRQSLVASGEVAWAVILYLLGPTAQQTVDAVVHAVVRWAKSRFEHSPRSAPSIVQLFGPDGEILAKVEIPRQRDH